MVQWVDADCKQLLVVVRLVCSVWFLNQWRPKNVFVSLFQSLPSSHMNAVAISIYELLHVQMLIHRLGGFKIEMTGMLDRLEVSVRGSLTTMTKFLIRLVEAKQVINI